MNLRQLRMEIVVDVADKCNRGIAGGAGGSWSSVKLQCVAQEGRMEGSHLLYGAASHGY